MDPDRTIAIRRETKPSNRQKKKEKKRKPGSEPRNEYSVNGSSTDEDEQLKI